MKKIRILLMTSMIIWISNFMMVNAEFDMSCFSDSNYIIELDDIDDTGTVFWEKKIQQL